MAVLAAAVSAAAANIVLMCNHGVRIGSPWRATHPYTSVVSAAAPGAAVASAPELCTVMQCASRQIAW